MVAKSNITNFKSMEAINLVELLVPGMDVFSVVHNTKKQIIKIEPENEFPIIIGRKTKGYKQLRFNKFGSLLMNGTECLIFPDKDTMSWEGFVSPVIFDKGEVVRAITESGKQLISIYSHFDKETQKHFCFHTIEDDAVNCIGYEDVRKISKKSGFLYMKQVYSKALIGRTIKLIREGRISDESTV